MVLFSRFGSHGSVLTVGFARFGPHGSVHTVWFSCVARLAFTIPCPGPTHRSVSKCSLRTARFTRFEIKSKITNRKSVQCMSLESIVFASLLCKMGPHHKDPLRPAKTRLDPLRPAMVRTRFWTRFATVRFSRFGSHGSVLTVRYQIENGKSKVSSRPSKPRFG